MTDDEWGYDAPRLLAADDVTQAAQLVALFCAAAADREPIAVWMA